MFHLINGLVTFSGILFREGFVFLSAVDDDDDDDGCKLTVRFLIHLLSFEYDEDSG